jgi:hypothetical protein
LVVASLVVVACVPPAETDSSPGLDPGLRFATTFGDADGNRYVAGQAKIAPENLVELPGDGSTSERVGWIVGVADGDDVVLAVADDNGNLEGFRMSTGVVASETLNISVTSPGTPPALVAGEGALVVMPPASSGALDTNALALESGGLAFVSADGALIISDGPGNRRLEVDALVDGRLTVSSDRRMAVLVNPTDRYDHGVVGDRFEASGVVFVSLETQEVVSQMTYDEDVIEGMVGMFADLDSDGIDEFILTVSNAESGARLVVLDDQARVVAESDPIGQSGRWRHQIAAAPFGPNGEIELVDVRTPHIRGVVEYFSMQNGRLELVASLEGYSSHTIRSRNLDMAVAFDADGDGQAELVVPNQGKDELAVLKRVGDGIEVIMTLPLDGVLSSNVMAVEAADGRVILVAATANGRLLIWD